MNATQPSNFSDFFTASKDWPVYVILGVQGSGTNLLRRFLVPAFNFSVLQDRSLIFNAAARLGRTPSAADIQRQFDFVKESMFPSRVRSKYTLQLMTRRKTVPFRGMEKHFDPSMITSAADFARFFYAYRAFSMGTNLMAIKSDDLWEQIAAIDEVIPHRRVVLITRDFRDNVLSITGKPFGPIEPICAAEYVKQRFVPYAAVYARAGDHGHHIRYESMLENPKQFLLDFRDRFDLAFAKPPEEVLAKRPLRLNRVGKWHKLPAAELAACEALLREELVAFGYTPVTSDAKPPDAATLLAARTRDAWKRVPQKLRILANRL
jgi:hypothetical protein